MIFAYLVSAYDQPDQLLKLLDHLLSASPDDFAVLHLDAKANLPASLLTTIAQRHGDRVLSVDPPETVLWGHYSQVVATRRQITMALDRPFDMAHLLSGSDWPVVPRSQIVADILATPSPPCCMTLFGAAQEDRMQDYSFHDRYLFPRDSGDWGDRFRKHQLRRASAAANWLGARVGHERSRPFGGSWRKGWHWWSLPQDVCRVVVEDVIKLERTGRMKYTKVAIEHVIPTIVDARFGDRVTTDRRFTDWEGQYSSPQILRRHHLPRIVESDAWFARKFDAEVDNFFLTDFPAFAAEADQLAI